MRYEMLLKAKHGSERIAPTSQANVIRSQLIVLLKAHTELREQVCLELYKKVSHVQNELFKVIQTEKTAIFKDGDKEKGLNILRTDRLFWASLTRAAS